MPLYIYRHPRQKRKTVSPPPFPPFIPPYQFPLSFISFELNMLILRALLQNNRKSTTRKHSSDSYKQSWLCNPPYPQPRRFSRTNQSLSVINSNIHVFTPTPLNEQQLVPTISSRVCFLLEDYLYRNPVISFTDHTLIHITRAARRHCTITHLFVVAPHKMSGPPCTISVPAHVQTFNIQYSAHVH